MDQGEATGRNVHDLLETVFPAPLDEVDRTLDETGYWRGTLHHVTKAGRWVVVGAEMTLNRNDGEERRVLEVIRDLTELHRAEEERKLALDAGKIGTFFIDLRRGAVTLDERGRILMKSDHDRLDREGFRALIPPAARSSFETALAECIGPRGSGRLEVEIAFDEAGGRSRLLSMRGTAEKAGRRAVALAGVMIDVSDRRRAEEGALP